MFTAAALLIVATVGYVGYRRLRRDPALRADLWARVRTYALAAGLLTLAAVAVWRGPTGETALVLACAAVLVLPLAARATAQDRAAVRESTRRAQLGLEPRRPLVNVAVLQARWVAAGALAYFCIGGFRGFVALTAVLSQHVPGSGWALSAVVATAAAAAVAHVSVQRRRLAAEDARLDALDRAVS
ncbi:hypothetical protein [Rhodococcus daqingensis]|uniref:DUF3180 domain-containing protein n=1 Tax=Rhodococcus daqingensis TaxID=2479363 RepID=A0ABW2S5V4_9NOCA